MTGAKATNEVGLPFESAVRLTVILKLNPGIFRSILNLCKNIVYFILSITTSNKRNYEKCFATRNLYYVKANSIPNFATPFPFQSEHFSFQGEYYFDQSIQSEL